MTVDHPEMRRIATDTTEPLGVYLRTLLRDFDALRRRLDEMEAAALETQRQQFLGPPCTPVVRTDPQKGQPA